MEAPKKAELRLASRLFAKRRGSDENVLILLKRRNKIVDYIFGTNIVCSTGEIYYAQKACNEAPTNNYSDMYLASNGPATPAKTDNRGNFTDVAGSNKAKSGGYPKSSDNDTDNNGAGNNVISWLFSYAAGDGNWTGITHAYVTKNSPSANDNLLCSIKFAASWAKDSNTSAKVFVNHGENGV
jgi:hypothetical protein